MDYEKFDDILSTIDYKNKEYLSPIIDVIGEIKKYLIAEPTAYSHLILRENYFSLIQKILECENELMIKFSFNSLQRFFHNEAKCDICSLKEKSQFMLNILRYIQHTHITNDITKLEIFKFLLSNHEIVEPILNSKILDSLIWISINEWHSENTIVQSSCKALIIKYLAIVCTKIGSYSNSKENVDSVQEPCLDVLITTAFANLLVIFNQEHRSFELRSFILECVEILLNNLKQQKAFDLKASQQFLEFTWQHFCPSILCQFGDCGLPSKANAPQGIAYKQIYQILIILTGLVGGNKSMIPVFEAIYQRILFYPPEDDRQLILKLFKTHVNKEFIESIAMIDDNAARIKLNVHLDAANGKGEDFNEFTLVNLIIGFYRNCYEKSLKSPTDKIIQLLSCECMTNFVQIIYAFFDETASSTCSPGPYTFANDHNDEHNTSNGPNDRLEISADLAWFLGELETWLNMADTFLDFDFKLKSFCLHLCKDSQQHSPFFVKHRNKLYACVYMSVYLLFKSAPGLNESLNLTGFKFEPKNRDHCDYFVSRIMSYDECDRIDPDGEVDSRTRFEHWLRCLYAQLTGREFVRNGKCGAQLELVLRQLDCVTRVDLATVVNQPDGPVVQREEFIRKLLKSSWTYFVDVLTGFLMHTDLAVIEKILFYDQEEASAATDELTIDNAEFTFVIFVLRASLDSLFRIIKLVSTLAGMDKELSQLMFILIESNYFKNGLLLGTSMDTDVTLNKIICLDFVLYSSFTLVSTSRLYNSSNTIPIRNEANEILWKYLIECTFFCFNLQNNIEFNYVNGLPIGGEQVNTFDSPFSPTYLSAKANLLVNKQKNLLKSVYANLNETIRHGSMAHDHQRHTTSNHPTHHHRPLQGSSSLPSSASLDKTEIASKIEIIFKNVFVLLENNKRPLAGSNDRPIKLTKFDLIDQLAVSLNDYISTRMFDAESDFQFIWQFCFHLCSFSRRFLLDESNLRKKNDYFTFNNLIVDKLEEYLIKIMSKFRLNQPWSFATNRTQQMTVHASLLPNYSALLNVNLIPSARNSIYSSFFTDLWLRVLVAYFRSLFFSKCAFCKRKKSPRTQRNNKKTLKSSKSFSLLNSLRSMRESDGDREHRHPQDNAQDESSSTSDEFLIDLTLFKKLICLVQRLFDVYNAHESLNYAEIIRNYANIKSEQVNLVRTPPSFMAAGADSFPKHDLNEPDLLADKLDAYRATFSANYADGAVRMSTNLLYNSTASLMMPGQLSSVNGDLVRMYLVDRHYNLNTMLLLPFKYLMFNRRLEASLKDAALMAMCELVECSSFRIKTAWGFLFKCLSHTDLARHQLAAQSQASLSDDETGAIGDDLCQPSSDMAAQGWQSSLSSSSSLSDCSSTESTAVKTLTFNQYSKFDSLRVRLNCLVDIFNIFLSLAANSGIVLANGACEFLRCVTLQLQHGSTNMLTNVKDPFTAYYEYHHVEAKSNTSTSVTGSHSTSATNPTNHFSYDHLSQLSKANDSNSQIKPFLISVEKFFYILVKCLDNDQSAVPSTTDNDVLTFLNDQSIIELNVECFQIVPFGIEPDRISIEWLQGVSPFDLFDFKSLQFNQRFIQFDDELNLVEVRGLFNQMFAADKSNTGKLLVFLIESLTDSILKTHDELNCVEIVQLVDDLMTKLTETGHLELVGYCLIKYGLVGLDRQIDAVELTGRRPMPLGHKLIKNRFFMSSLASRQLTNAIGLILKLLDGRSSTLGSILRCAVGKLFFLVAKLIIRRLGEFDSLVDVNLAQLEDVYMKCFRLKDAQIDRVCFESWKLFNLLSLTPVNTLLQNYDEPHGGENSHVEYSKLEMLTDECRSAWQLAAVKKSFAMAKSFFNKREIYEDDELDNKSPPVDEDDQCAAVYSQSEPEDEDAGDHKSTSRNVFSNQENEEKNFYRDFTIRLNGHEQQHQQINNGQQRNLFTVKEHSEQKEINLNSFVNMLHVHVSLICLVRTLLVRLNLNLTAREAFELLKWFNLSYLFSVKLDRLISFKILLSKVFYLNYENNLANFVNLTRISYLNVSHLYFKSLPWIFGVKIGSVENGFQHDIEPMESDLMNTTFFEPAHDDAENDVQQTLRTYFCTFVRHFCAYYIYLNEKSHNFKLDDAYLKNLMNKYETAESADDESSPNGPLSTDTYKEVIELFKVHKEHNKALTMLNLTQKTQSTLTKTPSKIKMESALAEQSECSKGDLTYIQKDFRFRYQTWSYGMVNHFLNQYLLSIDEKKMCVDNLSAVNRSLAHLIVVFNSCSSYCQCSVILPDESSTKSELQTAKDTSIKLLTAILKSFKNKDEKPHTL